MNKQPFKSLELLCLCGQRMPFDNNILESKIQCENCLKKITITYSSLSDSNTKAMRKIGYEFENILRSGEK